MILQNILLQSFQSLNSNRLRSALTMLGVVWGAASVVFLLGWGRGFVEIMHSESRAVGDGFVMVWPKKARSAVSGSKGARQLTFELEDLDAILDHCPSVRYVTSADDFNALVKYGSRLKGAFIKGVTPDALNMFNLDIEEGRFLQPHDLKQKRRVIVLGADLRESLFPPGYPVIGSRVKTRGVSLEVIGVLKKKGDTLVDWGGPEDEKAYIPITSYMYYRGGKHIYDIVFQPGDTSKSKACIEDVRAALAKQLDFSPDDRDAIEFVDIAGMLTSMDIMALILSAFITIIGVITLFVGGVGVMNIMLISVTERTREIGVRKAIGAKRKHILSQFMAEAMVITMLSGIIGILLGCVICIGFAAVPRPTILAAPEISLFTLGMTFLVMTLIGVFAGTLPAVRAANLDPIESLRFE
jgi:putative ABC transport system permease protein